jgi:hypothetical protein
MVLDSAGNVYVTGSTQPGGGGPLDYLTVSFGSDGGLRWARVYDNGGGDEANAVAVGTAGDIYVTGWSEGSGTSFDCVTAKYRADGTRCWTRRYNGPGDYVDGGCAVATGALGQVCVAGKVHDTIDMLYDFLTIMYDTAGTEKWVARYNGTGMGMDIAFAVAIDRNGSVYTGGTSDSPSQMPDYALVKYDSLGTQQWVARYEGPGSDEMEDMAVDSAGNVYLTGIGTTLYDSCDGYMTVKFDSSGTLRWIADYQAASPVCDWGRAVAADSRQNVYVTGMAWADSASGYDCTTIKYDSVGRQVWVARWRPPGAIHARGADLALDSAGNVYVTGASTADGLHYDVITLKYSPIGELLWSAVYSRPGRGGVAIGLELDGQRNVITGGSTWGPDSSNDLTVIKYTQVGALQEPSVPGTPRRRQCSPMTRGVLYKHDGPAVLVDCVGREVADLRPGANDVSGLAPGVYFVREEPQATSLKPQAVRKVVLTE